MSSDWKNPAGAVRRNEEELQARRKAMQEQHWSWIRYIILCAVDGALLGASIGIGLIWFNFQGIDDLLANSGNRVGYTLMLLGALAHSFGMVVAGTGIWVRAVQENEA